MESHLKSIYRPDQTPAALLSQPPVSLTHLAGTWTDEEADEFDALLRERRRIDPELWSSLPSR